MAVPRALTIAGSDSSGGAGIQADLKTFSALGVYGASAVTAVTAQNTLGVQGIEEVSPSLVTRQIESVMSDLEPGAIKIGMLSSVPIIEAVVSAVADHTLHLVLDPVMIAKSGDALLADVAVETLRARLIPLATLITPNLHEAARLTGCAIAGSVDEQRDQARQLATGRSAVLVKGGHGSGDTCIDVLLSGDGQVHEFSAPRIDTRNTHGTGCSLSAAIAAYLARGLGLEDAIGQAHEFLQGAIASADRLGIGSGSGPVHHFHALWSHE